MTTETGSHELERGLSSHGAALACRPPFGKTTIDPAAPHLPYRTDHWALIGFGVGTGSAEGGPVTRAVLGAHEVKQ